MTFGIKTITGVVTATTRKGFFGTVVPLWGADWGDKKLGGWCPMTFEPWTVNDVWVYMVGAHLGHLLELSVAIACHWLLFADGTWLEECKTLQTVWIVKVLGFNLACEIVFAGGWHWLTYASRYSMGIKPYKFNSQNQYESTGPVGVMKSSSGQLEREIFYSTLGWLQSATWQVVLMWLWASGRVPFREGDFWSTPGTSLLMLGAVTYWREIHFYWCHRGMHPWWDRKLGLLDGDVGAFLYRHAHSLHHKSHNPGPWSGLSMHPVEHFLYYSCAWLPPLFIAVHPLHFLYAKFHADIAPIGGHDGYDEPSANGDFHWLHHSKFECNYGVPFPFNFDKAFGSWADYQEYKANGNKMPSKLVAQIGKMNAGKQ